MSVATLDQQRATHAWQAIAAAKQLSDAEKRKYGIHAKKLPTRIMASGLGQAMTFLLAKKYSPLLLKTIGHWVLTKKPFDLNHLVPEDRLIKEVIVGDAQVLRRHTAECLAYLQWLIRFAEAEGLADQESGDD